MKKPIKTRTISRACNIRDYVYRATVNAETGQLINIRAGCRWWNSFAEAEDHYASLGDGKWSSEQIRLSIHAQHLFACREEARRILEKLRVEVFTYQHKAQVKLRAARRAKRAAAAAARKTTKKRK